MIEKNVRVSGADLSKLGVTGFKGGGIEKRKN